MTNTEKITAIENKIRAECEWLAKYVPFEEKSNATHLEPQLSDLLYVIQKTVGFSKYEEKAKALLGISNYEYPFEYNLSLPFKQNLEQSPELVEFLFNLICK